MIRKKHLFILCCLLFPFLWECKSHKQAPKPRRIRKTETPAEPDYTFFKVLKNQKIGTLAKQLKVTVQDLKRLNPGLEDDLKVGQTIKVPKFPTVEEAKKDIHEGLKVSLLLPFTLSAEPDTGDVEDVTDRSQKSAIEFYEGALIALDSLQKEGISASVRVFDSEKDSMHVRKILEKKEVSESNLIIGPLGNSQLIPVSKFAKTNNIFAVSPVSTQAGPFTDNPNMALVAPSVGIQCAEMENYIYENYKKENIVLITTTDGGDQEPVRIFKSLLTRHFPGLKNLQLSKVDGKIISNSLSAGQKNIVVIPSSNEAFVMEVLNNLNYKKDKYNIQVVGLPVWERFQSADFDLFQNLKTLIFKASYIDRENPQVRNFIKTFRKINKAEPGAMAFAGFDVMYYYLNLFKKNGKKAWQEQSSESWEGLHGRFEMKKNSAGAFENHYVNILQFSNYGFEKKSH